MLAAEPSPRLRPERRAIARASGRQASSPCRSSDREARVNNCAFGSAYMSVCERITTKVK